MKTKPLRVTHALLSAALAASAIGLAPFVSAQTAAPAKPKDEAVLLP